ncbi:MAG: MBL fold metallo-hydrolase [Candidatus Liptonbacteria bacterium]
MQKIETVSALILITLIFTDAYVWLGVLKSDSPKNMLQFLDVGKGDSQLITAGDIHILNDTGPPGGASAALQRILPPAMRRLDLIIITHPERDHFGDLPQLLKKYSVGAILWNGIFSSSTSPEWTAVLEQASSKKIPVITIGRGDTVHAADALFKIMSPDPLVAASGAVNESAIVSCVRSPDWSAILSADVPMNIEAYLLEGDSLVLNANILKVGHHGSAYSSSDSFLENISPEYSVIQLGEGNTYGFPSKEALVRLRAHTKNAILRTDELGTITFIRENGKLVARSEHNLANAKN